MRGSCERALRIEWWFVGFPMVLRRSHRFPSARKVHVKKFEKRLFAFDLSQKSVVLLSKCQSSFQNPKEKTFFPSKINKSPMKKLSGGLSKKKKKKKERKKHKKNDQKIGPL